MSDTTDLTAISTRTVLIEPQLGISFPAQHRRKSISRGNAGMRSYCRQPGVDAKMQHFRITSGDGRREYRVNPLNG